MKVVVLAVAVFAILIQLTQNCKTCGKFVDPGFPGDQEGPNPGDGDGDGGFGDGDDDGGPDFPDFPGPGNPGPGEGPNPGFPGQGDGPNPGFPGPGPRNPRPGGKPDPRFPIGGNPNTWGPPIDPFPGPISRPNGFPVGKFKKGAYHHDLQCNLRPNSRLLHKDCSGLRINILFPLLRIDIGRKQVSRNLRIDCIRCVSSNKWGCPGLKITSGGVGFGHVKLEKKIVDIKILGIISLLRVSHPCYYIYGH